MSLILILDLDGVVSPLGRIPAKDETRYISNGWGTWQVRETVVKWLTQIISKQNDKFRIILGTTWNDIGNILLNRLNLPSLEYIEIYDNNKDWIKEEPVIEYVEKLKGSTSILWVDDELRKDIHLPEKVSLMKPNGITGLTNNELEIINEIVKNNIH